MKLTKTRLVVLIVAIAWALVLFVLAVKGANALWWSFAGALGVIALAVLAARRNTTGGDDA